MLLRSGTHGQLHLCQEGHSYASQCKFTSSRAQNRHFCALLPFVTLVFGRFEHKNGIFVSETAIFPWFWLFPSTKSRFLCFFGLRNPHFRAFREQNRGFCALLASGTPVFGLSEHKIGVFVLGFSILAEIFELGRGGARRGTYLLTIMAMNYSGLIIAVITFLVIGLFHPIVIKGEYYFGTKCWWFFALCGVGFIVASLLVEHSILSPVLGVVGCSCLWSILEIFEQRERVKKGWFPMNPKRKEEYKD